MADGSKAAYLGPERGLLAGGLRNERGQFGKSLSAAGFGAVVRLLRMACAAAGIRQHGGISVLLGHLRRPGSGLDHGRGSGSYDFGRPEIGNIGKLAS